MRVSLLSVDAPGQVLVGGKHVHLQLLARGLAEAGLEVNPQYLAKATWQAHLDAHLASPAARWQKRLKRWAGLPWATSADRLLWGFAAMAGCYRQPLASAGQGDASTSPHIINAHDALSAAGLPRDAGPVVLTLHGYLGMEAVDSHHFCPAEARRVLAACQRYEHAAVRRASAIITVDSRIRQDVIDRLGARPEQVFVIHNAVDTQRFCPVTPEVQRALKIQLNLPPEAFVVLCPRRLVRKNGGAVAARAAALLPRPAMLLLVGDGPERPAIAEALATAPADRWRWLPPISYDTVAAYYQAADAILVPSIPSDGVEEATSLTMLEGMACGKPVLCSAIGGMAEVLQAAAPARVGLPLPPGQPSAIAEAIANILSNPQEAQHLGQAARTWAEARHGYQAHARHFIDIFEHCLADHTPK